MSAKRSERKYPEAIGLEFPLSIHPGITLLCQKKLNSSPISECSDKLKLFGSILIPNHKRQRSNVKNPISYHILILLMIQNKKTHAIISLSIPNIYRN